MDPVLNRSFVLEAPLRVADGAGGFTDDWQPLGVLWGDLRAGSGRELQAYAANVSRVPCRITVRATPYGAASRPRPGQRFRDGARVFDILAVAEKGFDGRFLTCHAEEVTAA